VGCHARLWSLYIRDLLIAVECTSIVGCDSLSQIHRKHVLQLLSDIMAKKTLLYGYTLTCTLVLQYLEACNCLSSCYALHGAHTHSQEFAPEAYTQPLSSKIHTKTRFIRDNSVFPFAFREANLVARSHHPITQNATRVSTWRRPVVTKSIHKGYCQMEYIHTFVDVSTHYLCIHMVYAAPLRAALAYEQVCGL
jgi:hypothetical protein